MVLDYIAHLIEKITVTVYCPSSPGVKMDIVRRRFMHRFFSSKDFASLGEACRNDLIRKDNEATKNKR